ncbi:UNVERIFIED_CONTAM: hypothetical protein HDU68_003496 [Siphonaria sp. JEL0065]|nr:hypothetical protein HDU68_003496 [Siphonaria sp. JEL0065]
MTTTYTDLPEKPAPPTLRDAYEAQAGLSTANPKDIIDCGKPGDTTGYFRKSHKINGSFIIGQDHEANEKYNYRIANSPTFFEGMKNTTFKRDALFVTADIPATPAAPAIPVQTQPPIVSRVYISEEMPLKVTEKDPLAVGPATSANRITNDITGRCIVSLDNTGASLFHMVVGSNGFNKVVPGGVPTNNLSRGQVTNANWDLICDQVALMNAAENAHQAAVANYPAVLEAYHADVVAKMSENENMTVLPADQQPILTNPVNDYQRYARAYVHQEADTLGLDKAEVTEYIQSIDSATSVVGVRNVTDMLMDYYDTQDPGFEAFNQFEGNDAGYPVTVEDGDVEPIDGKDITLARDALRDRNVPNTQASLSGKFPTMENVREKEIDQSWSTQYVNEAGHALQTAQTAAANTAFGVGDKTNVQHIEANEDYFLD